MSDFPTLSIAKRPDLDRDAWSPKDLVVKLGGVEITNGLRRLDLALDVHEVNSVVLALAVDLVEVDLEALAEIRAHIEAERPEAEVIPIDRGPDPQDDPA